MIVPEKTQTPYLAVVPARGGSKRVPRKNLRTIAGRPLLAWTIDHVRDCETPMRVVVSTDDVAIRALALQEGAEAPMLRPDDLATDESPTEPTILHALDTLTGSSMIRHIILLPPTSPIRDEGSLDQAVRIYEQSGADSLVSVAESTPLIWRRSDQTPFPLYDIEARPRLQNVPEDLRCYRENGSIVITSVSSLRQTGNRLSGKIVMFEMQPHEGIDIDDEYDLWLAEQWIRRRNAR